MRISIMDRSEASLFHRAMFLQALFTSQIGERSAKSFAFEFGPIPMPFIQISVLWLQLFVL